MSAFIAMTAFFMREMLGDFDGPLKNTFGIRRIEVGVKALFDAPVGQLHMFVWLDAVPLERLFRAHQGTTVDRHHRTARLCEP
jgi:hypothetical protein